MTIDFKKVATFLEEEWLLKNDNKFLWDYDRSRKIFKSPYQQLMSSKISAEFLVRGEYNLKIDDTVHRYHSNLTNMRSLIRNAVTYDGENLVAVDIKNSQPYFSILLLRENFWTDRKNSEIQVFYEKGTKSKNNIDPRKRHPLFYILKFNI